MFPFVFPRLFYFIFPFIQSTFFILLHSAVLSLVAAELPLTCAAWVAVYANPRSLNTPPAPHERKKKNWTLVFTRVHMTILLALYTRNQQLNLLPTALATVSKYRPAVFVAVGHLLGLFPSQLTMARRKSVNAESGKTVLAELLANRDKETTSLTFVYDNIDKGYVFLTWQIKTQVFFN